MTSKDHDFDWVTALNNCTLPIEFSQLRRMAQNNTEKRKKDLPGLTFDPADDGITFAVCHLKAEKHVVFELHSGHIHVGGTGIKDNFQLTLTLNDGSCPPFSNQFQG